MKELNYEKAFNTLVEETANYVTSNGLKAMVLGISGGIDSTVVAAICHEVSKKTDIPLIGRSLPIKNKEDEFDVSKLVGEAFCDDFNTVSMGNCYHRVLYMLTEAENSNLITDGSVEYDIQGAFPPQQTPIADGNIQARLRMIYLYNLASIHKGLVMSTDNQTEYQLGFWTIHGDVGDFNPLQDLWKTEVYGLARWIVTHYQDTAEVPNRNCWENRAWPAIVESIKLTPTDGLGISNSDLEQIGAKSYAEVDDILQTLLPIEHWINQQPDILIVREFNETLDSLYTKYSQEVVDKVWKRHIASEFKRKKSPIYISRNKYDND